MPTGRPSRMHEPVTINVRGEPSRTLLHGDYFLEMLAQGRSLKNAADLAGLGDYTVREWIARGEGRDADRAQDDLYANFARSAREAMAQGRAIHERSIVLAGVPRQVTTVTTREVLDEKGQVVTLRSTSTREEFDWRANAWALTHVYGVQPPVLEVAVEQRPVRETAERLTGELAAFLAGRDSVAQEAESSQD